MSGASVAVRRAISPAMRAGLKGTQAKRLNEQPTVRRLIAIGVIVPSECG